MYFLYWLQAQATLSAHGLKFEPEFGSDLSFSYIL